MGDGYAIGSLLVANTPLGRRGKITFLLLLYGRLLL